MYFIFNYLYTYIVAYIIVGVLRTFQTDGFGLPKYGSSTWDWVVGPLNEKGPRGPQVPGNRREPWGIVRSIGGTLVTLR